MEAIILLKYNVSKYYEPRKIFLIKVFIQVLQVYDLRNLKYLLTDYYSRWNISVEKPSWSKPPELLP